MEIIFQQLTNQNYPFTVEQRVSRALSVVPTLIGGRSFSVRLEKGTNPPELPLTLDTSYMVFQTNAVPHDEVAFFQLIRWADAQKDALRVSFTLVEKWEMHGDPKAREGVFSPRAKTASFRPTTRCVLPMHSGPLTAWVQAASQKDAALADRSAIEKATQELQDYLIEHVLAPLGVRTRPTPHKQNLNCEPGAEEVIIVRPPTVSQVES